MEFSDDLTMVDIARCESNFRQFNENGEVLRGVENSSDVGVFQINETYHLKRANELGIDLHTLEGNVRYARILHDSQGVNPWKWSFHCWKYPADS